VRWRLIDLARWIFEYYRISVTKQILSRELRAMGYRKLSARPRHHAQDVEAMAAFKKTSPPSWRLSPRRRASCNTEAMALHLEEIAAAVAPGAHAIFALDQAGWHVSKALPVPPNITLVSLPPKSPELNPVENVQQFMRDNWLSNRVFNSYTNIVDH
jgi:hypothetical protein